MAARDRCDIFALIDDLDASKSVRDLVARLKPILNHLAYYAVTGDAAVTETHETWHDDFTDRLYDAVDSERAPIPQGAPPPRGAPAPVRAQKARHRPAAEGGFKDSSGGRMMPPNASAGRPHPGSLTPALQRIMEGTHPSLSEQDYH